MLIVSGSYFAHNHYDNILVFSDVTVTTHSRRFLRTIPIALFQIAPPHTLSAFTNIATLSPKCIFWRKLMPMLAMSLRQKSSPRHFWTDASHDVF